MRIIHAAMILSIFLYVDVFREIGTIHTDPMDNTLIAAIGVIALFTIAGGYFLRSKRMGPAASTLRTNPEDANALAQWRKGAIVSAALAEAIVLYGVSIYLIGGNAKQTAPFFVVGLIVMLLWWPKRP
jgi:hypothetical protein